jgi:integrase
MTLSELIAEYLGSIKKRSEKTIAKYTCYLKKFLDFAGDIDLAGLTPALADEYMQWLAGTGCCDRTIVNQMSPLRGMVQLGFKRDYIPMRKEDIEVPVLKGGRRRGRKMSLRDYRKMLKTARRLAESGDWRDVRNLAMLAFTGDTWCRLSGLLSLTLDNLDLDSLSAVLREKYDRLHPVQFTEHTRGYLARWLEVRPLPAPEHGAVWVTQLNRIKPMATRTWGKVCDDLARAAGVTGPHNPHSIRHMSATEASKQGVRLEVIRDKCGHVDSRTTMQYYLHADDDDLRDATGDVGNILFGGDD